MLLSSAISFHQHCHLGRHSLGHVCVCGRGGGGGPCFLSKHGKEGEWSRTGGGMVRYRLFIHKLLSNVTAWLRWMALAAPEPKI